MQLASRFAFRSPVLRSEHPLSDDQIRAAVLTELRKEGFRPFMVCQTRVRAEDRRDFTKHIFRLCHANQINAREVNEIILLNSHDGTSSYQLLAGMFRFVCQNGLVCGDTVADVRVPQKGDVTGHVVAGAYQVSITDDHAAQEAVFYEASQWQRTLSTLRERLAEREIGASHVLVRFVGLDAYEGAGGDIRRELSAEGDAGAYVSDTALLETPARDKLTGIADKGYDYVRCRAHLERRCPA